MKFAPIVLAQSSRSDYWARITPDRIFESDISDYCRSSIINTTPRPDASTITTTESILHTIVHPIHRSVGKWDLGFTRATDRRMNYHVLIWKIKVTVDETGTSRKKKSLVKMTDIWPCVGTMWHELDI